MVEQKENKNSREYWEEYGSGPGKFEGEPSYVPYYWDKTMDGSEDDTIYDGDTPVSVFIVSTEDINIFPELKGTYSVLLWEDDYGFVNRMECESKEKLESLTAELEKESAEGGGEDTEE
jgi:hypothetical protein